MDESGNSSVYNLREFYSVDAGAIHNVRLTYQDAKKDAKRVGNVLKIFYERHFGNSTPQL